MIKPTKDKEKINKKLVHSLAKNDLKAKFAGSYLGIVWAFVQPIITIIVYWFVFQKVLNAPSQATKEGIEAPYVLWLSAGLIPWFYFSEALSSGTNCLIEYNYLVKKVVFNVSVLPVVKVLSSLFTHVVLVAFMVLLYILYGLFPGVIILQLVYYTFCIFCLALAFAYMTSAIVVFFRDMQQMINVLLQVFIWVTPIMWNMSAMAKNLSSRVLFLLKLNPMYYVVRGYRDTMIGGTFVWEHIPSTLYFWGVTIGIFLIGKTVFKRLRPHFADVL